MARITATPPEERPRDSFAGNWRNQAACVAEDPELFFPVGEFGPGVSPLLAQQVAKAKAVCQECPVRAQCLRWALVTQEDFGVWGGLSEQERRALLRRPRAVA